MKENPFALPNGEPIPGKYGEWWRWRDKNWKEYLATLSEDEREAILRRKRMISHRVHSEVGYVDNVEELMAFVELVEYSNPYSKPSGMPRKGEFDRWIQWNISRWTAYRILSENADCEKRGLQEVIFFRWEQCNEDG